MQLGPWVYKQLLLPPRRSPLKLSPQPVQSPVYQFLAALKMRLSSVLVGVSLQALQAAALPVGASDSPFTSTSPALASSTPAAPVYDWSSGYVSQFVIHPSCNSTERHEITSGLEQAVIIAKHAKEHSTAQTSSRYRFLVII